MALYACIYCGSHFCDDDCRANPDENLDNSDEFLDIEDDYDYGSSYDDWEPQQ